MKNKGFTLIEVLVALGLVSAILLPTSLWLFSSKTSQAAMDKFRASQFLEVEMNRAFLQRVDHDVSKEIPEPNYLHIKIHPQVDGLESKLMGTALDRKGKALAHFEASFFASVN